MRVTHISNKAFSAIPAFPLKGVHLFPNTVIQLHIFEPRYVEMVDYAIEHNDCVISIANPLDHHESVGEPEPNHGTMNQDMSGDRAHLAPLSDEQISDGYLSDGYLSDLNASDHSHTPPLHPILGAGFILHREEVAPQRYNIFVLGIARLLIREELQQTHLFRQVDAEVLQDVEVDPEMLWLKQVELRNTVLAYAEQRPDLRDKLHAMIAKLTDVDILSFTLGAHCLDTPDQRRLLFEEVDPLQRVTIVTQKLCDEMISAHLSRGQAVVH